MKLIGKTRSTFFVIMLVYLSWSAVVVSQPGLPKTNPINLAIKMLVGAARGEIDSYKPNRRRRMNLFNAQIYVTELFNNKK